MRIFRKERMSLVITKARACRAKYMDGPGTEEIHLTVQTEEGDILTLQLKPQLAPTLIRQLSVSYEAINPPLRHRFAEGAAEWDGME